MFNLPIFISLISSHGKEKCFRIGTKSLFVIFLPWSEIGRSTISVENGPVQWSTGDSSKVWCKVCDWANAMKNDAQSKTHKDWGEILVYIYNFHFNSN